MKYLIPLFLFIGALQAENRPEKADEITYDFLIRTGKETGYCDHIPHIQKIFEHQPIKILLEFGLGYSTKYFLDHCTKVLSVEFVMGEIYPSWMRYCLDLYKGYSNWVPIAFFSNHPGEFAWAPYKYFASGKLFEAERFFATTHQIPEENAYCTELRTFIGNLTKFNKVDLALVDPGILLRGVLVELLFDKVSIILAQDADSFISAEYPDTYGYRNILTPDHYEVIFIPKGKGTLLWIKKTEELATLIQTMKDYAKSP